MSYTGVVVFTNGKLPHQAPLQFVVLVAMYGFTDNLSQASRVMFYGSFACVLCYRYSM